MLQSLGKTRHQLVCMYVCMYVCITKKTLPRIIVTICKIRVGYAHDRVVRTWAGGPGITRVAIYSPVLPSNICYHKLHVKIIRIFCFRMEIFVKKWTVVFYLPKMSKSAFLKCWIQPFSTSQALPINTIKCIEKSMRRHPIMKYEVTH